MILRTMTFLSLAAALLAAVVAPGCSDYREGGMAEEPMDRSAQATIDRFRDRDPSLQRFFDTAYGYAVFPEVDKGGAGIGGAHGHGVVYEQGRPVGDATLTQGTIGFQLGGQEFSEVIFFQDRDTFDRFRRGNMELAANASAVAAADGRAASADWEQGVAVFTLPRTGLMFEAAIGGQKFGYRPW